MNTIVIVVVVIVVVIVNSHGDITYKLRVVTVNLK